MYVKPMKNQTLAIINRFERVRPRLELKQEEVLGWLSRSHAQAEEALHPETASAENYEGNLNRMQRLFARFGCSPQRIAKRGMEVLEAQNGELVSKVYRIEPRNRDPQPSLHVGSGPYGAGMFERTREFSAIAARVFGEFYPAHSSPPEHIIHVTCTGYSSPSAPQVTVDRNGWSGATDITHAYHMGCYASIPAVRMAAGFVHTQARKVDVVHTEVCSLHMNPLNHSPEQLVVYSLFADGHIKYSLEQPDESNASSGLGLIEIKEFLIPGTQEHMSWDSSDWGMKMTLSQKVPAKVGEYLPGFLKKWFDEEDLKTVLSDAIFAIHPGGPKIIDSIQELLNLREDQVAHSKQVLLEYGNMSSATLPHVWQKLYDDPTVPSGKLIVSLAFGPGLTIFGALLKKG